MIYYVVYQSKVRQRTTKDGWVEHYVDIGIFYDKDAMVDAM